jgi:S-DNA-T family DNA segregation ATPase FtsK/SpoIIIE
MPPQETSAKSQPPSSKNSSGSQDTAFDRTLRLFTRFERFSWDLGGIALLAVAAMTLVALILPGLARGFLLTWWSHQLAHWFGWGSVWVVSALLVIGLWMLRRRYAGEFPHIPWGRVFSLELAAFSSLALLALLGGASLERASQGLDGGAIGWGLSELLRIALDSIGFRQPVWQGLLLGFVCLVSILAGTGLLQSLSAWAHRVSTVSARPDLADLAAPAVVSEAPLSTQGSQPASDGKKKRSALPAQFRKNFRVENEEQSPIAPPPRDDRLPPLELLFNEQASRPDERNINLTAGLIEKTLSEFGIPAKVVGFRVGPTVTQFAVEPGFVEKDKAGTEGDINRQKVRVAQIASLHRDLALALSAERLRIEAPVPGRPYVGIAGTTGSGKSVCIAAITTCLVMNNTPEDLRLVMVDPKMVELVRFNGLPHLLGKVETDLERILAVLRWTVAEMDRRYKLLEASRSRNIDSYNRKARRRKGVELMPRIVLMIDELADLMMSAPDQTEHNLVRLAQMARATGIHLVVATQRPSTDVVTGLIKANFPARISFAVASSIDSRVILDSQGAEALLGRGDMLLLQPDASAAVRSQGALVTDQEIERVITFWQKTLGEEEEEGKAPWDEMLEEEAVLADRDDLVEKAVRLVRETQRASASLLQRRLRIGYPRAARLIDELEELGVIGPPQSGGRDREVLVGPEDAQPDED